MQWRGDGFWRFWGSNAEGLPLPFVSDTCFVLGPAAALPPSTTIIAFSPYLPMLAYSPSSPLLFPLLLLLPLHHGHHLAFLSSFSSTSTTSSLASSNSSPRHIPSPPPMPSVHVTSLSTFPTAQCVIVAGSLTPPPPLQEQRPCQSNGKCCFRTFGTSALTPVRTACRT